MDRPDYLDEDDEFQEAVKAERSKILRAKRNRAQTLRSPSVSSALARAGTIQMTELKNGPSRSRCRTGSPKLCRLTSLCSQKRSCPGSLILPSECNTRLTSSPSRPWSRSAPFERSANTSPTTRPAAVAGPMAASERLPNGRPPDRRAGSATPRSQFSMACRGVRGEPRAATCRHSTSLLVGYLAETKVGR